MLRVKSAVSAFCRATRAAARASTFSSFAISFSMIRVLQSWMISPEGAVVAGNGRVGLRETFLAARVYQQAKNQVDEFVTGCALDWPILAQRLMAGEDLLDDEVEGLGRLLP